MILNIVDVLIMANICFSYFLSFCSALVKKRERRRKEGANPETRYRNRYETMIEERREGEKVIKR